MGSCGGWMMVAAFVAVVLTAKVAVARDWMIGGNTGWTPDKNYTDWSNRHNFYVEEDWLRFRYANGKEMYDVVEVNQTNYESCNGQDFIKNITTGNGRDLFHLTEPKTYYFICSKGNYCRDNGMKIAVTAHERPSSPPKLRIGEDDECEFLPCEQLKNDQEDEGMVLYRYNNLTNEFESLYTLATAFVAATGVEGKKVIYPRIKELVAKMKLYPTRGSYGGTSCLFDIAILFLDVAKAALENGEIDLVPDKIIVPVEEDGFTIRKDIHLMFPLKEMQSLFLYCSSDLMQHAKHMQLRCGKCSFSNKYIEFYI